MGLNKMLAHCFNPQLGMFTVFGLAGAAVNQNQARFKYRFYTVSEIRISFKKNWSFNNDTIIKNSFAF